MSPLTDFTNYTVPGVYVQDSATPVVTTNGVPVDLVTLIGAALGYKTQTDVVTLGASAVPLSQRGAWLSGVAGGTSHTSGSIPIPVVTSLVGTLLVEGTDYTMSYDISQDGIPANGIGSITSARSPINGVAVSVVYKYTDTNYYAPTVFDTYGDVVDAYGQPLLTATPSYTTNQANAYAALATQITSPLSLGAKVAFENGANQILAISLDPSAGSFQSQFQGAYAKIASNVNASLVVPIFVEIGTPTTASTGLTNVENLATDLANSVNTANNNSLGRIGIFGTTAGLLSSGGSTPAAQADYITVATGVNNSRVMMAYPNKLNYYNGSINQTTVVDGAFLAAAYAGLFSSQPVNRSITRQIVKSFAGIPASIQNLQTKAYNDALSKAGIAVTETNRLGNMVVRHGVTTNMTGVLTREPSTTRQRDALLSQIQQGLDSADLIGSPITEDTPTNIQAIVTGMLEAAVADLTIAAYTGVSVRQQTLPTGDPTAIQIQFSYAPALPLNYVIVNMTVDLSSGDTTVSTSPTA